LPFEWFFYNLVTVVPVTKYNLRSVLAVPQKNPEAVHYEALRHALPDFLSAKTDERYKEVFRHDFSAINTTFDRYTQLQYHTLTTGRTL
jgi:hypothetical protein